MDQFFSNIFPWMGKPEAEASVVVAAAAAEDEKEASPVARKRVLHRTSPPALISTGKRQNPLEDDLEDNEDMVRPTKIFRGERQNVYYRPKKEKKKATPLEQLPADLVAHCLSFLGGAEDRFALQCTSKQFQRISNSDAMMIGVSVGGDPVTGVNGLLQEDDTPVTAAEKLTPFCRAGNLEALYMLGIIKSYCDCDVHNGISLLKMASAQGYVRASYALGLVLRDSAPDEASKYMRAAADAKYLPALQEMLPAREMKLQYGEPKAEELRRHLDHLCLSRLLSRHYVRCDRLRTINTSHCWNPLCGRWAYKQAGAPVHHRCVSRMKMCSRCCRAKYCSKLCQVYDWRSGRHKMECQFL